MYLSSAVLISYTLNFIQGHFTDVWACKANVVGLRIAHWRQTSSPLYRNKYMTSKIYSLLSQVDCKVTWHPDSDMRLWNTHEWQNPPRPKTEHDVWMWSAPKNRCDIKFHPQKFFFFPYVNIFPIKTVRFGETYY